MMKNLQREFNRKVKCKTSDGQILIEKLISSMFYNFSENQKKMEPPTSGTLV